MVVSSSPVPRNATSSSIRRRRQLSLATERRAEPDVKMYATTENSELLRPTRDADRGSFFGKRLVSTVAIALGIACVALAVYAPNRIGLGYVLNYGTNGAASTIDSTIPAGSNCSAAWCVRASRRVASTRAEELFGVGLQIDISNALFDSIEF